MPLSVLEAMAANKAVVATNVDGTSEIVVNGETGILVQPGNAGSLAEAISAMLGDKQLRDQFGIAGGDRVRKLYTSQVMIAAYQSLYDMVAKTILGVPG
jgi:glycosyltransferase involved in cell wall biosynthesis